MAFPSYSMPGLRFWPHEQKGRKLLPAAFGVGTKLRLTTNQGRSIRSLPPEIPIARTSGNGKDGKGCKGCGHGNILSLGV